MEIVFINRRIVIQSLKMKLLKLILRPQFVVIEEPWLIPW